MDTILNSSEQTFQLPLGGVLTMRQASPGAAAVCALQFADAPIVFSTAVVSTSTPTTVGPFNANVRLMVAAAGQIAIDVGVGTPGVGGSGPVVNDLVTGGTTVPLAAQQGVVLANQVAIANNSAANAFTSAAAANSTATAAAASAASAAATATAAAAAVAGKLDANNGALTGVPTAPTAAPGTNTTQLATTGFAVAAIAAAPPNTSVSTVFASAIPFDSSRYMPLQSPPPAAFTVNPTGSKVGGECMVPVQANGVIVPTFAGMILAGAQPFANVNGQTNDIYFWRSPSAYYYGIVLGTLVDVIAPALVSATVSNATPTHIDLVWSEPMNATMSAAAAFAISAGHTLTAHTYVDSTHSYLTTSAAFVNGEAARTLAYTQPGSNKMQDVAGNLLVNIATAAITNNVGDITAPTLVSATVQNAAANVVEVVFSEALGGYPTGGNLPASSAFTVSGHTVTGIAWGTSAAMVKLTLSAAFVNGEAARTLAYTQPGTNNIADPSANQTVNFSGQAITNNVVGSKITFSDSFTGTNGSAPNARWTPDQSGWTIQSNQLNYNGAAYSFIYATCTAGDNTVSVLVDPANTNSFAGIAIRYIDANNYTLIRFNGAGGEFLQIQEVVGGTGTVIANDTADRRGLGGVGDTLTVSLVGSTCTVTVTGGPAPGSFSGSLTSANSTATKIALAMNSGKTGNFFDDCVLS